MSATAIVASAAIAALLLWVVAFGGRLPRPLRRRPRQDGAWHAAFPQASDGEIEAFLALFTSAFALSQGEGLKLSPSDAVLGIYRARYRRRWLADALELEALAEGLERTYGFSLAPAWHDRLTLGELFAQVAPRSARAVGDGGRMAQAPGAGGGE